MMPEKIIGSNWEIGNARLSCVQKFDQFKGYFGFDLMVVKKTKKTTLHTEKAYFSTFNPPKVHEEYVE